MRVLVLAPQPFFQLRGTPIATKLLLERLSEGGYQVDLLTLHEGADVDLLNCRIHRIPRIPWINGIPPGFSIKKLICDVVMLVTAWQLCRKQKWDVIHAIEESVFIAWLLKKRFGIPYVYDMDSSLPEQLADTVPVVRPMLPLAQKFEAAMIAGSHGVMTMCKSLEDLARLHAKDAIVVRVEDFSLLSDENAEAPEVLKSLDGPIVMYVGNLQSYQGIDLLLNSFAKVQVIHPDARLVICGGSPKDVARYRKYARYVGIDRRTHLLGVCDLPMLMSYLQRADVLVSPRLNGRNTPMKIYSYLDSGTPVVATQIPSHSHVLSDNVAVMVSPNVNSMSEGISQVLDCPAEGIAMGKRAQQYVQDHFRPEAALETIDSFYAELTMQLRPATVNKETMLA